jgi:pimeloyl-ACP methyl ester carboxylesterase
MLTIGYHFACDMKPCCRNGLVLVKKLQSKEPPASTSFASHCFYVAGMYVGSGANMKMSGQMFVEQLEPVKRTGRYPVVMLAGTGQTGAIWLSTPDERPGWAKCFAAEGYTVFVADQPGRGRSASYVDVHDTRSSLSPSTVELLFTASQDFERVWPEARLHSQWPGSGRRGDPVFDAFYASQVPFLTEDAESERLAQSAGVALLDRIGPAILLTHSQASTSGWLLAESRPDLVRAVVAVEPQGPPFEDFFSGAPRRPWGLTALPLTYDPNASAPGELRVVKQQGCWAQEEPARKLVNLIDIPMLIVTGEASYHIQYDRCTVQFLKQSGVKRVDHLRLADCDIHGNGHMLMLEKNNLAIAKLLQDWIAKAVPAG